MDLPIISIVISLAIVSGMLVNACNGDYYNLLIVYINTVVN